MSQAAPWDRWMHRAIDLAQDPRAPRGVNPRVGCVVLDADGELAGEGLHEGAGSPHAEVVALTAAGSRARGGTAVVTLEPCRHVGRTGPCTEALITAGITRVVFAVADPSSDAGGGSDVLRSAGVEVIAGVQSGAAEAINREWMVATARGYPFVTAKVAVSLDGRVAGAGGRRVQLTGPQAHEFAHRLRARVQAVVTGTGTVLADDPVLTVRAVPVPVSGQPLRVVVGQSDVPADRLVFNNDAPTVHLRDHDPLNVLRDLFGRGVRDVLLESGPRLLAAFWQAGCIDEIEWLLAGVWLGEGPRVLPEGVALHERVTVISTEALGQDVRVQARPVKDEPVHDTER